MVATTVPIFHLHACCWQLFFISYLLIRSTTALNVAIAWIHSPSLFAGRPTCKRFFGTCNSNRNKCNNDNSQPPCYQYSHFPLSTPSFSLLFLSGPLESHDELTISNRPLANQSSAFVTDETIADDVGERVCSPTKKAPSMASSSRTGMTIQQYEGEDPGVFDKTMDLLQLLMPPILSTPSTRSSSSAMDRLGPTDYAYVGDVVYELLVRTKMVWPPKRTSDLQNTVVGLVRAEYQAGMLKKLKQISEHEDDPHHDKTPDSNQRIFYITAKEGQLLNRGRNAVSGSARRRDPAAYGDATALETLLGYLYLTDTARCAQLLKWIHHYIDTNSQQNRQ